MDYDIAVGDVYQHTSGEIYLILEKKNSGFLGTPSSAYIACSIQILSCQVKAEIGKILDYKVFSDSNKRIGGPELADKYREYFDMRFLGSL